MNGIESPNEKLINKPTPLYRVAEFEVKVNRAPKTGPIHGVKPKAKVKPKTKFLNVEYFFITPAKAKVLLLSKNILHDTYVIQLLLYTVVKVRTSFLDSKLLPQFKLPKI